MGHSLTTYRLQVAHQPLVGMPCCTFSATLFTIMCLLQISHLHTLNYLISLYPLFLYVHIILIFNPDQQRKNLKHSSFTELNLPEKELQHCLSLLQHSDVKTVKLYQFPRSNIPCMDFLGSCESQILLDASHSEKSHQKWKQCGGTG